MNTDRSLLLQRAKDATTAPGVYLMKDLDGLVIYVGKAKNLRNRLMSYFQPATHEILKTEMLVRSVEQFDVILTETENEALILECTLIKRHKPRFNIRLKDDKSYPYLKIQIQQDFPRIEWARRVARDGARYFGPFTSSYAARDILRHLTENFRLRDCSDNVFRHRSRACILYQMDRCSGPCVGYVSREAYRESIQQAVATLEGKSDQVLTELKNRMHDSAENEEYEMAAEYRDRIQNLELVTQSQSVIEAGSNRDRDVVGLARESADAHGVVLQVRAGQLIAVKHYHLQNTDSSQPNSELLMDFLTQHYVSAQEEEKAGEARVQHPQEVLLPESFEDVDWIEKSFEVTVRVPDCEKEIQLMRVAQANAKEALIQSRKKGVGHGLKVLEEIQKKLHLPKIPVRIECYDISNTQGEEAVGSRVVFVHGAPDKNLYRRYKIKTVQGANDFAMMKEVLGRRFSNDSTEELPDLVVVDGGKGQLAQATAILSELNVQGVEVVGLAKARTESDFRSSELKSSMERIFIPHRVNPIPLYPHSESYQLLTHIRDEAHRFAIRYHRLLRGKKSLKSAEE